MKSYIYVLWLSMITGGLIRSTTVPQGLIFKLQEAGTQHDRTKAEIANILQDKETALFVTGSTPEQSMSIMEKVAKQYPFLLCYKDNMLVAGVMYRTRTSYPSDIALGRLVDASDTAYVGFLFVNKEYRRQGIGTALAHQLIRIIQQRQPELATLHGEVVEGNHTACQFYESLGARNIGEFLAMAINKRCTVYAYTVPKELKS